MIITCYNCKGFRYVWIPVCNKPVACPVCDGCGELQRSEQLLLFDGEYECISVPAHSDFNRKCAEMYVDEKTGLQSINFMVNP